MRRVVVLLALFALGSTAHAGPKDRQVARLASGISAAVSGGVVFGGFMLGEDSRPFNKPILYTGLGLLTVTPSAGEIYAAQYLTIGMAVRAAGLGVALYTLQTQTKPVTCQDALSSDAPKCVGFVNNAYPLLGVAAITFIGGVWYDVLDAADSADRYNVKHGFSVTATPTALAGPNGIVPGVALSGSF